MTPPTRVLIADDAADIRALVRFVLSDSGAYDLVAGHGGACSTMLNVVLPPPVLGRDTTAGLAAT